MTPDRWKQIEELYLTAASRAPEDREALFAQTDPEVCATVLQMLSQRSTSQILDRPAWDGEVESGNERPAPLEPGTELGPYRIDALLGQGGMGTVYRAFDPRFGRDVAVKVLSPAVAQEQLAQFEQEAWASGTLSHPNILTVYDVGSHNGIWYLVSELLSGHTLREVLQAGPMAPKQALANAHQIASALITAHEKGITHCDLKPENIFLTEDGRLKVLDFGLARLSQSPSDSEGDGLIRGTPGYMSPEQVRGELVDQRSDLFNCGLVFYEMLTGSRAFLRSSTTETLNAIVKDDAPISGDNPAIGPEVGLFLRRCLAKNPGDRFQNSEYLTAELEALPDRLSPQRTLVARRKGLLVAVTATGLALTVALMALWPKPERSLEPVGSPLTLRHGNISTGRFTPDAKAIVYSAAWEGGPMETYLRPFDHPEEKGLGLPDTGILAISSTGELALASPCELVQAECRGVIVRKPPQGKPELVVEDGDFADWSPQGRLAIVRKQNGHYRVEYPIGHVLYENPKGRISHLRFSPKGNRIAFLDRPGGNENGGSVVVIDLQGNRITRSTHRHTLKGLAWSPSGDEIWFSGTATRTRPVVSALTLDGKEREIYRGPGWIEILDIARDGRVLLLAQSPSSRIIFDSPGVKNSRNLAWMDWSTSADLSADGKTLLFSEGGESTDNGQPVTYLRDTSGGDAKPIGEGQPLALSPDRKWALAVRKDPPHLILLPTDAGEPIQLSGPLFERYITAAWFPNSKRIVFVAEGADQKMRTFIQDIGGGPPRPVGGDGVRAVLVSPDGLELAAYGPDDETFYRIPVEGGKFQPIPGTEPFDELTQWSSDGRFIYVSGEGDSDVNIFRIDLGSGKRVLWKYFDFPDKVGSLGLDLHDGATRITPDGAFTIYTYWWALGELSILK